MIDFHRLILGDTLRNDAFTQALKKVIKKGETIVADIGSGTGYLAFLASKLGARECHLYEHSGMLELSREIAKKSGITNCIFHHLHSTQEKNPPKVDVVVSETLGNYALEENIVETLQDARRFLRPGGVMIPQKLTQYVAPVTSDRFYKELDVWDLGHALDFSKAREVCFNNIYVRTFKQTDLLADSTKRWDQVDFREDQSSIRETSIEWTMQKNATIHGFALWWECELLPGITLSTDPASKPTHWEQIYLPVPEPLDVEKGGTLSIVIQSDTRYEVKVRVKWEVEVKSPRGEVIQHESMDMWKGQ